MLFNRLPHTDGAESLYVADANGCERKLESLFAFNVWLLTRSCRRPAEMVLARSTTIVSWSLVRSRSGMRRPKSERPDPLSRTGVATLSTRPSCTFRPRNGCSEGERKMRGNRALRRRLACGAPFARMVVVDGQLAMKTTREPVLGFVWRFRR
jgi:hypothetical protein